MKSIKRRTFLSRSVVATAALGLASYSSDSQTLAGQDNTESRRPNPIAVSTYSFLFLLSFSFLAFLMDQYLLLC